LGQELVLTSAVTPALVAASCKYDAAMDDEQEAFAPMVSEFDTWLDMVTKPDAYRFLVRLQPPLSPLLAQASREALAAARVKFSIDVPQYGSMDIANATLRVQYSPDWSRRVFTLKYFDSPGALLWIDGQALDALTGRQADLVLDCIVHWLDDDTFTVQIGGLEHPRSDPRVHTELGTVLGLLIVNAARRQALPVLPKDAEDWPDPRATRHPGRIDIHADKQAMRDQRVARSVAWS
jgi:hypothetical protein